jgi:hypothetical protein
MRTISFEQVEADGHYCSGCGHDPITADRQGAWVESNGKYWCPDCADNEGLAD